jgi:hypothetical protein
MAAALKLDAMVEVAITDTADWIVKRWRDGLSCVGFGQEQVNVGHSELVSQLLWQTQTSVSQDKECRSQLLCGLLMSIHSQREEYCVMP